MNALRVSKTTSPTLIRKSITTPYTGTKPPKPSSAFVMACDADKDRLQAAWGRQPGTKPNRHERVIGLVIGTPLTDRHRVVACLSFGALRGQACGKNAVR